MLFEDLIVIRSLDVFHRVIVKAIVKAGFVEANDVGCSSLLSVSISRESRRRNPISWASSAARILRAACRR